MDELSPTTMNVQLLGKGDVILFSISKNTDMNVNFVIGANQFASVVIDLLAKVRSEGFGTSPLNRLWGLTLPGETEEGT